MGKVGGGRGKGRGGKEGIFFSVMGGSDEGVGGGRGSKRERGGGEGEICRCRAIEV